jgi:hypothetical protein
MGDISELISNVAAMLSQYPIEGITFTYPGLQESIPAKQFLLS